MTLPEFSMPDDQSFRLLVDAIDDYAICMLDSSGRVATWNTGARKMMGYAAGEIVGRHVRVLHTPDDAAAARMLAEAAADGRAESEGWRRRKDGSTFRAHVVVTAIHDESNESHGSRELRGFAKVTQDVSGRGRRFEQENARRLAADIQAAREEEQARIAHELHDDLGQHLTALKMAVAELSSGHEGVPTQAANAPARIEDINRLIDGTVSSLRRIATGLRPIALETLGLSSALEWLIDDFAQRYALSIRSTIRTAHMNLDDTAEAALFRIVQEALTNVARHARATEVSVELVAKRGETRETCVLRIADNGRGAAREALSKATSFGLQGMAERVRRLDGTLSIDTAPGDGLRIAVAIPLGPATRANEP